MRKSLPFLAVAGMVQPGGRADAVGIDAEKAAIRKADEQMVAAANAHDLNRWLSFFAPDARMMPPGEPPVEGKDAIGNMGSEFLKMPGFSVAHHLETVEVSRACDLAYIQYSYEIGLQDPSGKPVTEKGKDITLLRKGSGGTWQVIVDMWSPNESHGQA